MSRSIKLKNDNYLDSTSIVHGKDLLSNGFMKVYSCAIAQNGSIVTSINANAKESRTHYIAFCVGNTSNQDYTWLRIYLLRRGYDGNHITATEIVKSGNPIPSFEFTVAENGNIRIKRDTVGGNASVSLFQIKP